MYWSRGYHTVFVSTDRISNCFHSFQGHVSARLRKRAMAGERLFAAFVRKSLNSVFSGNCGYNRAVSVLSNVTIIYFVEHNSANNWLTISCRSVQRRHHNLQRRALPIPPSSAASRVFFSRTPFSLLSARIRRRYLYTSNSTSSGITTRAFSLCARGLKGKITPRACAASFNSLACNATTFS